MTIKNILILGAGRQQTFAIARAKLLGFSVIAVDMDPSAEGLVFSDYPLPNVSTHDPDAILSALEHLKVSTGVTPDGVLTMGVEASHSAAEVCQRLGLPGITPDVANNATNKASRLKLLHKHGVSCPDFHVFSNRDELLKAIDALNFPCVVKICDRAGAEGISFCDNEAVLRENLELPCYLNKELLVEQYIVGTEHSSESIIIDGQVHTTGFADRNYDTKFKYPPYFLENGDTAPTCLSKEVHDAVLSEIKKAIRALNITTGVAKGDIIVSSDGTPYILEMATRLSGDYFCSHTIPLHNGTDIVSAAILQAVGEAVPDEYLQPKWNRGVALRYVWPMNLPGKVASISGLKEASLLPDVSFAGFEPFWDKQNIGVGTRLSQPTCHGERVASLITTGENRDAAIRASDKVLKRILIEIEADE